ncbi:XRE family transcriptional regulator [Streptomyces thermolilacinus]|uniref:XRE family transcriptional regulator n=1 Tax=Streptomyces thermolilacinus TaxID=285540 RepID=UPI0033D8384C
MPRWKALPEGLDPEVREFAGTLRRLVDRGGLGLGALADRTGYSRTSWERYLNGRLLAPKDAVVALAEVTGTDPVHVVTLWELAERAWSRAEKRRDQTLDDIRIAQARAALEAPSSTGGASQASQAPSASAAPNASGGSRGAAGAGGAGDAGDARRAAGAARPAPRTGAPHPRPRPPAASAPHAHPRTPAPAPYGPSRGPARRAEAHRHGRTVLMFFAGALGTLLVFGAAMLLSGLGDRGEQQPAARPADAKPAAPPGTGAAPSLPVGVGCYRGACDGQDPHTMGCGGAHASTVASTIVDTALVEVRYSRACRASWARISRAAPGDTVEVTAPGGTTRSATADADGDAYTPMVVLPVGADASACAALRSGATGCTEAP